MLQINRLYSIIRLQKYKNQSLYDFLQQEEIEMSTKLVDKYLKGFVEEHEYKGIAEQVKTAHNLLHSGTGMGNDFLGWLTLPTDYDKEEFDRIKKAAEKIKKDTDVFIVIGIGGSYLGARAAIEFLNSQNYNALAKDTPQIYFTGNSISSSALADIMELCEGKDVPIFALPKQMVLNRRCIGLCPE